MTAEQEGGRRPFARRDVRLLTGPTSGVLWAGQGAALLAFWMMMSIRLHERRLRLRRRLWLGFLAACLAAGGCSGGQDVTADGIKAARELWSKAGIRDYELEYTTTPANGHFLVTVHDGEVKKVEAIQPGGTRVELHPGAPRYYSVDGLFLTIADELAQLEKPSPFEQPKGTRILMKFKTNPELGYPEWYCRDIMGASQSARIDVIKLTPAGPIKPEKE
jgi:hypothetical protein